MSDIAAFESKVEQQCNIILKTDSEFWEVRNKAIVAIRSLVTQVENAHNVQDLISMNVFRLLKDPIKNMISDLRSQQVRDTCSLLMKLSDVVRDNLKHLLREIFQFLFDGIKVPNRVMSGYVDQCILHLIKHTTFKSAIPILVQECRENKSKMARERALEYLNEILTTWEITDKEADVIVDAVKAGLEDASVRAREISRFAYLNIYQMFPRKAEKVKASLHGTLRSRLTKAEEELLASQPAHSSNNSVGSHTTAASVGSGASAGVIPASPPRKAHSAPAVSAGAGAVGAGASSKLKSSPSRASPSATSRISPQSPKTTSYPSAHSPQGARSKSTSSINSADDEGSVNSKNHRMSVKPAVTLKSRRQSFEENAVTAIQAMIRGGLTRRQTVSKLLDSEHTTEDNNTDEYYFTNTNSNAIEEEPQEEEEEDFGVAIDEVDLNVQESAASPRAAGAVTAAATTTPAVPTTPTSVKYTKKYDARGMPLVQINRSSGAPAAGGGSPSGSGYHHDETRDSPSHNTVPSHLIVGASAVIKGKDPPVSGIIRYVGLTKFASGYWVGLELTTPAGKNNGTVQGTVYFECAPNCGLFVRPSQVIQDSYAPATFAAPSNTNILRASFQQNNNSAASSKSTTPRANPAKAREEFTALVKGKIFDLMTLLNQQLDIVEQMERQALDEPSLDYSNAVVQEILALTSQEMEVNELFQLKAKQMRGV